MIYINGGKLSTELYTKPTDRHMYLNYHSEHPPILRKAITYFQFLRIRRIHLEPQYSLEAQIMWGDYPCNVIMQAWGHSRII